MKSHLLLPALLLAFAASVPAHAATVSNISNQICASVDTSTNAGVRGLQEFLHQKGYLESDAVIGTYGPRTAAAVKKFQADNALSAVGTVGPQTRALIQKMGCAPAGVPASEKLTLVGYEMPEELEQRQQGAWVLQLSSVPVETSFTYGVIWGDEGKKAPSEKDIDNKILLTDGRAIFTHTYAKPGRYKQTFNVMSSEGEKIRLQSYVDVTK